MERKNYSGESIGKIYNFIISVDLRERVTFEQTFEGQRISYVTLSGKGSRQKKQLMQRL